MTRYTIKNLKIRDMFYILSLKKKKKSKYFSLLYISKIYIHMIFYTERIMSKN